MSFASKVKSEILGNVNLKKNHKTALGYGMIMFARHFGADEMRLTTESREIADIYCEYVCNLLGREGCAEVDEVAYSDKMSYCTASVPQAQDREELLRILGGSLQINRTLLANEGDQQAFISGAYLACGTVTNPQKNYLIEFVAYADHLVKPLAELMDEAIGHPPKVSKRRGMNLLYYRESEKIEDALTAIGASGATLEMMEVKIVKEMRNKVNRVTNCETANIDKTVTAASEHINSIRFLIERVGEEGIPEELREIAKLRVENPEMSLRELADSLSEPMSRSGVNHRLQKLCRMAQELKN